jgi:hypothetical protein
MVQETSGPLGMSRGWAAGEALVPGTTEAIALESATA